MANPDNKDGFNVAVVDFAVSATVVHGPRKATALEGQLAPLSADGPATNITSGLQAILDILEAAEANAQKGVSYLWPVVLCFTDGCHNSGPHPRDVANRLKQKADLVMVAFGTDADEALLRELASSPQHCYRCANGRELRSFLASVGKTLTQTMAARVNASKALTQLQR